MLTGHRLAVLASRHMGLSCRALGRHRVLEVTKFALENSPELAAEVLRDVAEEVMSHRGQMRTKFRLTTRLMDLANKLDPQVAIAA